MGVCVLGVGVGVGANIIPHSSCPRPGADPFLLLCVPPASPRSPALRESGGQATHRHNVEEKLELARLVSTKVRTRAFAIMYSEPRGTLSS